MRILYGVVGEGMGHATRSRVVIDHLLRAGHVIAVVASDRAYPFLCKAFEGRAGFSAFEIHGLHLDYKDNILSVGRSVVSNLGEAPEGLAHNIATALNPALRALDPQVVVSDFESWSYYYGLNRFLPVISIDNMQVINRCEHPPEITRDPSFQLAKAAVKVKLPGAHHYLVTTFFYPPVRKERTTLVPPILRPAILAAKREPKEHVLVYQTGKNNPGLVPFLQRLPGTFRVYGLGREGEEGNVSLRPFSEQGFVDDLRTAKAAVAGGGFSLMSECVHLGVPMFSVPIDGQYEQELNARYLAELGYGRWSPVFDEDKVADFLAHLPSQTGYAPQDNSRTLGAVDALLGAL